MRKRIGVFMSEVASEYQKLVLKSIFKRAKELNYDVFVFATYGSYGDNVLYAEGEMGMLSLPVLSELDGIIVGEDTLDIAGMESELEALLRREAKCPVVYLRAVKEDFYNIRLEDERAMEDVTRHFVYKHGFRDICFMGGKKWTTDAHDRYNGFLKVMREVGVEVTEHMVFEGDYWRNKGKEAVDWFMEGRDSYPQAIICANDFMAISICEELDRRGVNVPSQVCVSGYDNITEARLNHPSLTSVSIPFEIIATKAVEMIDNVCSGREQQRVEWIHFEFLESESCGCGKAEALRNWSWMPRKMYKQDNNLKQVVFMTTDYQGVFEGKDYLRVAEKYIYNISFEKAFLCMCDKEDGHETEGYYSEEMTLRRVYTADHKTLKKDLRFYRKDLLPKDECDTDEPQAYFLFSIHHKNKCFGYLVLTLQEDKWLDAFTQAYLMSLANAIEDAQMHQEVSVLEGIKKVYLMDPLTGIYNRRGFEKGLRTLREKMKADDYLSIVSIDMDGLKFINDNFGHAEGDDALIRLANVIKDLVEEGDGELCARMGGDEFSMLLLSKNAERHLNFAAQFQSAMQKEEERVKKPYPFRASVGICCIGEEANLSLMACMQLADKRMYIQKKSKRS